MKYAQPSMLRLLMAGATAAALIVTAPVAVSAAAPDRPDRSPTGADHTMGSQIRKHEPAEQTVSRSQLEPAASGVVYGIDVSHWQGSVDWAAHWNNGKRFAWIKATEGTNYTDPKFAANYTGSYGKGFIRGAYHFALPNKSSGAAQAKFFSDHGGGWSGDGRTLPGALDLEYNPYGSTCYGLTKAQMTSWIRDFSNYYKSRWDKYPAIYTSTSWWNQCVNSSFSGTNPLWVARYNSSVGSLPYNWSVYSVWQYSSSPIDQNRFNGSMDRLKVFATSHD